MGRIFRFPINGAEVEIDPAALGPLIGLYEAAFRRELECRGALDLANLAVTLARADGVPVRAAHVERAVRALLPPPAPTPPSVSLGRLPALPKPKPKRPAPPARR